jgi:hypothetical protein
MPLYLPLLRLVRPKCPEHYEDIRLNRGWESDNRKRSNEARVHGL